MSGNLIAFKKRIRAVENTRKITRAMKTVSAAKLRRSVTELHRNRPLLDKIETMLSRVAREYQADPHPFLVEKETGKHLLVVVSSDKGLCGAFNTHVLKEAEEYYKQLIEKGEEVELVTFGTKASRHFKKREYPVIKEYLGAMARLQYEDARALSAFLQDIYRGDEEPVKNIEFVFTEFESSSRQTVARRMLFPLKGEWEKNGEEFNDEIEYIFEPSAQEIFDALLPQYINTLIYRVLLESSASVHAARMIAMDLATRNAVDMIKRLTLTMNKMRQASITKELLEIITATEALKK